MDARVSAELLLSGARLRHVRAVAQQSARLYPTDEVLFNACWLHDIGYATGVINTGMHALDGAAWCRAQEVDEEVVSLVAWHTGAWFEAKERDCVEALEVFARPPDVRLDALTLCDLTSSPTGEEVDVPHRVSEILSRYLESDPVHRAVSRSQNELIAGCRRAIGRLGLSQGWGLSAL